jgi:hypothetical protein
MGLLFVAVQLNRERIVRYPSLRGRALEALLIFLLPLIAAILLAIPGQSMRALGTELVILGVTHWLALAINSGSRLRGPVTQLDRLLHAVSPGFLIGLLTFVSGALLLFGRTIGLDWLVVTIIVALIGGIGDAWILLVAKPDDGDENGAPKAEA